MVNVWAKLKIPNEVIQRLSYPLISYSKGVKITISPASLKLIRCKDELTDVLLFDVIFVGVWSLQKVWICIACLNYEYW